MSAPASLDLGVTGNCIISALVDRRRASSGAACRVSTATRCSTRCSMAPAQERGAVWSIEIEDFARVEQGYEPNTAVLRTRLYGAKGKGMEITDFCPRFERIGRMYRPVAFLRIVRPVAGAPRVRINLAARRRLGRARRGAPTAPTISAIIEPEPLRLTTDAPVIHLLEERSFRLENRFISSSGRTRRLSVMSSRRR